MSNVANALRPRTDGLLHAIVNMANTGAGTSATILVGGTLISGELLGATQYADETTKALGDAFRRAFPGNASGFDQVMEDVAAKGDELGAGFLHLAKIVRHQPNGGFVTVEGATLRVRITDIEGFWLGRPTI